MLSRLVKIILKKEGFNNESKNHFSYVVNRNNKFFIRPGITGFQSIISISEFRNKISENIRSLE